MQLGTSVDPDKVAARHVDGRLTVTVGRVDAPETRAIAIDTTPVAPAIESSTTDESAEGDVAPVETAGEDDQSTGTSSTA